MPETYTIEFTNQELITLNEALIRLPFGQVAHLISRINEQLEAQRKTEGDVKT